MALLSGVHCITCYHCKFRPNTEGHSVQRPGARCSFFDRISHERSAIEFHAYNPLEVLPCVRSNDLPFGWPLSYRLTLQPMSLYKSLS
jgi:hypothetical protein